jgi:hypothetical protein
VKLLVVTPEPVDAKILRATLGDEVRGAEVLVISPATNRSKVAFWVSDSDEAIAEAESAQRHRRERAGRRDPGRARHVPGRPDRRLQPPGP